MNLLKVCLVVAVIFCLVCSVGAISAEEVAGDQATGSDGQQIDDSGSSSGQDDIGGYAGSNYAGGEPEPHEGAPEIDPDYAHMEPGSNTTDTGNATYGNATSGNTTANATGNATNHTAGNNTLANALHNLLATGNPIFIVVLLIAIAGGITVYRRK